MSTGYPPKNKRKTNLPESIFFILLVILAAFVLFQSPLFEVRQILVKGTTIPVETVKSISGISPGQNIFKLDRKIVEKKIKYLPVIKNVEVTRNLPSTVIITVEERVAIGILPVKDGFVQVDMDGIPLRKAEITNAELPVITGVEVDFKDIGEKINSKELDTVLKTINSLPVEILPELSEVHFDNEGRIQLYMLDGIQCRLGLPEKIEQKGRILLEVMQELETQGKKIEYIDLSYFGKPVVKYISQPQGVTTGD
ncbi:cell division protein FtsQ/DivIB [Desulfolucanica intricata]|uniref:cell division protein FtsQ/DivIB n=1 Tax=Desulfolucanica intricata TaxID=1285191 RepID=UPI00082B3314|nr:cell division protein FtsQ/DivIB [Desulfolucanica intricata]